MLYNDFTLWLHNYIDNLQEPTRLIVYICLLIGFSLLLIGFIWLGNKMENKKKNNKTYCRNKSNMIEFEKRSC